MKIGLYLIVPFWTYSQGTTEKEAEQNLREALSLFFITCLEMGTLNKVMKDCGFKVSKNVLDISQKPAQSMTMKYMDVPIPVIFEQMKGQQERCQV
jgi:hypothetical protein